MLCCVPGLWKCSRGVQVQTPTLCSRFVNGVSAQPWFLHRCLQHMKEDLKKQASTKDEITGYPRLRRGELLSVFIDFLLWSAFLPSDLEFDTFWREALLRMEAQTIETDWKEPVFAQYLRAHCLQEYAGFLRAPWQCGVDATIPGYTTYAPSAIERSHRTLKDLLDRGLVSMGLGQLMDECCKILNARVRNGFYASTFPSISEAPAILYKARTKATVRDDGDDDDDEDPEMKRVIDYHYMFEHFEEKGAAGTFLVAPCRRTYLDGRVARLVYVIPKRTLSRATGNPDEMQAMLQLALAPERGGAADIKSACASPQGTYDILFHMKLRRRYVAVFYGDGFCVDEHKQFIDQGGHSAHALFVLHLNTPAAFSRFPQGPERRTEKGSPKKPRRSEALTRMLQAPPSEGNAAAPVGSSSGQAAAGASSSAAPDHPVVRNQRGVQQKSASIPTCAFRTVRGVRCAKPSTKGLFCTMHDRLSKSDKCVAAIRAFFLASAAHRIAPDAVEKWELEVAKKRSLKDDKDAQEKRLIAQTTVYRRLLAKQMSSIDTISNGDCLFDALIATAGLAKTPLQLRGEICDYLESHAALFVESFPGGSEAFDLHVERMRRSGTWGTTYEITAASHLLLRPIHLITDTELDAHAVTVVEPLQIISPSAWGETVYLAHFLNWHYEGTRHAPCPVVSQAVDLTMEEGATDGNDGVSNLVHDEGGSPLPHALCCAVCGVAEEQDNEHIDVAGRGLLCGLCAMTHVNVQRPQQG